MNGQRPRTPGKRRGTTGNTSGRFERQTREALDDGWWQEEPTPSIATEVRAELCRSAFSRNTSPDIGFDRSLNPYRGCEHGCVYCYARPTHAYLGLSPGLDFETRLSAKLNLADVLAGELRRSGYRPAPVMLGANTDPYQPIERRLGITRGVIALLAECRHPLAMATKSALILRDLDLLAEMAAHRLVSVGISVTTLDRQLARRLEPRASSPARRLRAIEALAARGVPVAVLVAPMIPALNDHELERILAAAAASGATGAHYTLLRLPHEVKELFRDWLAAHYPERSSRVLAELKSCRAGTLYVSDFATRMRGTGVRADLLADRFRLAARRYGLDSRSPAGARLDVTQFRPPPAEPRQLSLFG